MLKRVSRTIHPGVGRNPIPHELQKMGIQIMESRQGEFCSSTFVNRNLYSQCLYLEFPWCSDPEVNAFFRQMLHFDGQKTQDGFLLIGEIDL